MSADIHVLTGAYACDALDLGEQDAFEEHLAGCESCALEVAELRATTAALAAAEAVEPPEALRERVLAQIAVTRQLPPIVPPTEPAAAADGERGAGRRGSHSGRPANEGQEPAAGGPTHRRPGGTARPGGPGRRWTRVTAWASSTALVVGILFLGGVVWHQQGEIDSLHGQAQSVTQLLAEPDAHAVAGHVQTGGTITVISSSTDNGMVFSASDLPALPAGKAYQVWMINGSGVRPGPVVEPVDGRITATFTGNLDGAKTIAMSVEPSTGSAQPTTTPIAAVTLAS
ncbi:MAG TPA: anti-sigma factor [Actinocrinis sp.]|nr:anti-sigma factor [Actinocrinis sp.]